ncbi:hypothetical protein EHS25_000129 [Saitozyma podzolica]|uniref:Uncharacterized protein n=1 Tax=Saitozyma podzolica TaxID=1890683 RepID=A0A427YV72_9TREE|nr:hypothetical protein EHS25_000129 [Saitozyma podzolica]
MDRQHSPATTATTDRCDTPTSMIDLSSAAAASTGSFDATLQEGLDSIWEHRQVCTVSYCKGDGGSIHPLTRDFSKRAQETLSALKKMEQTRLEKCQTAKQVCDAYSALDDDSKRKLASEQSSLHMMFSDLKHWGWGHVALYNAYLAAQSSASFQMKMETEVCSHLLEQMACVPIVKDASLYEFCSRVDTNFATMLNELKAMASDGQGKTRDGKTQDGHQEAYDFCSEVEVNLAKMVGELSTEDSAGQSEA